MEVTIQEAAERLGVSESAVRRRLRVGTLDGRRDRIASGFRWVCVLPDGAYPTPRRLLEANNGQPNDLVVFLQEQLATKDEQIGRLIDELRETRKALPAPRSWAWRLWRRRRSG